MATPVLNFFLHFLGFILTPIKKFDEWIGKLSEIFHRKGVTICIDVDVSYFMVFDMWKGT